MAAWTLFQKISGLLCFRKSFLPFSCCLFAMINALGFDIVLSSKFSWKKKIKNSCQKKHTITVSPQCCCNYNLFLYAKNFYKAYFEVFLCGIRNIIFLATWWPKRKGKKGIIYIFSFIALKSFLFENLIWVGSNLKKIYIWQ